jgi:hypothetical protein
VHAKKARTIAVGRVNHVAQLGRPPTVQFAYKNKDKRPGPPLSKRRAGSVICFAFSKPFVTLTASTSRKDAVVG